MRVLQTLRPCLRLQVEKPRKFDKSRSLADHLDPQTLVLVLRVSLCAVNPDVAPLQDENPPEWEFSTAEPWENISPSIN